MKINLGRDDEGEQDDDLAVFQITREQKMAIRMYCTNEKIGWKPALRQIITIAVDPDVLAVLCTMGRRNSKFTGLPSRNLHVIKGMNASVQSCGSFINCCMYSLDV